MRLHSYAPDSALRRGHFAVAKKIFLPTLELCAHAHGELPIAISQQRIARADVGLQQYDEAIRLDEKVHTALDKDRPPKNYANFLETLGGTYDRVGRWTEAVSAYRQAVGFAGKKYLVRAT